MSNKIDATYRKQETKRELTPKLRFPEFRDASKWNEKKLGQIGDILMCKRIFAEETNDTEGVPFFKIGTLGSKPDAFISKKLFDEYKSKYNFPRKGEILITCSGTVGKCLPYDGNDAYYQDSNIVWIDNPTLEISNEFLHNLLLNVNWGKLNSTTITRIYGSDLRNLSTIFPVNRNEQQKIADCLSSIDELIAAQTQKLGTLRGYKKGLMQQLFPAQGETLPQRRFSEFQNAPEWNEKRLGEISDIKTGPFGSVLHESDYVEIGTPIITVEHLDELGIKGNNFPRVSDSDRIRLSSYKLKEGDIVFSRVGSVDRCSIIRANEEGWLFSGRLLRLRIRKPKENSAQFLNQLLKYEPNKTKIRDRAVGQTMPSLNTEILNNISFHLPLFIEQQKIADCLSSIDELIAAQTQKLDALKTHKKGLMQQLFPSLDETQA